MYADWASLQDEIKFDKANESVLHRYPGPVGRDVACHVVKTIAQNLSFSVSNPDPSNLLTDKEVKWTMEVGSEAYSYVQISKLFMYYLSMCSNMCFGCSKEPSPHV